MKEFGLGRKVGCHWEGVDIGDERGIGRAVVPLPVVLGRGVGLAPAGSRFLSGLRPIGMTSSWFDE
jgi:hypothetical protein